MGWNTTSSSCVPKPKNGSRRENVQETSSHSSSMLMVWRKARSITSGCLLSMRRESLIHLKETSPSRQRIHLRVKFHQLNQQVVRLDSLNPQSRLNSVTG